MKIGVNFKINLSKLDKSRFFRANSGDIYANFTSFVDTENTDRFDNHGAITQGLTKEERQAKVKAPFVGNSKIFWKDSPKGENTPTTNQNQQEYSQQGERFDDPLPF